MPDSRMATLLKMTPQALRNVLTRTGVDMSMLGIQAAVPTPAEIEEGVLVVIPCEMVPEPKKGSAKEQCPGCGRDVWVAATSPVGVRRVCVVCLVHDRY